MSDKRGVWQSVFINAAGEKKGFCSVCGFCKEVDKFCGHCGSPMSDKLPTPILETKIRVVAEDEPIKPERCVNHPRGTPMTGCFLMTVRLCETKGKCGFYNPESAENVAQCFDGHGEKLSPRQMELLQLMHDERLTLREAAQRLGIKRNSLFVQMERIKTKTGLDPRSPDDLRALMEKIGG